jgi:integrase
LRYPADPPTVDEIVSVIQRQLGHADLAITSPYLRGIDNTEIIQAEHERPAPMVPATARLTARL